MRLTRLLNAESEIVGYFSDHVAEMAARMEWNEYYRNEDYRQSLTQTPHDKCRSIATPIVAAELEDVEPCDGDRVDYVFVSILYPMLCQEVEIRHAVWIVKGATSVEVQRFLINRYRRPGHSNRDADLSGPVDAAGVLYVLRIKAPK